MTLLDRSKDLVISGGTNIYPREVEEALLTHPYVAEVAVIGRPDPEWGEVLVAYVVSPQRVSEAELDAHCLARVSPGSSAPSTTSLSLNCQKTTTARC